MEMAAGQISRRFGSVSLRKWSQRGGVRAGRGGHLLCSAAAGGNGLFVGSARTGAVKRC